MPEREGSGMLVTSDARAMRSTSGTGPHFSTTRFTNAKESCRPMTVVDYRAVRRSPSMLSTAIRDLHKSFPARNWRLNWQVAALVVTACSLGWMIASENWLFVAGVCALLLLIVRPIEVALGLYAFLIPFESMTTMNK